MGKKASELYARHKDREADIATVYYKLRDAYYNTGEEVHISNSKDEATKNLTNLRDELSKLRKLSDSEKLVTWQTAEACDEIIGMVNKKLGVVTGYCDLAPVEIRRRLGVCSDHDAP